MADRWSSPEKERMAKVTVKTEEEDVPGEHAHSFRVKFGSKGDAYTIRCTQACRLLEGIKLHLGEEYRSYIKCPDENVFIKLGKADSEPIVATSFPCSCVKNKQCLIIYSSTRAVEAQNQVEHEILPKKRYSLFFIDKECGKNTKSKANEVFRYTGYSEPFKSFCVYGEKGTTVEEALNRDGRFADHLSGFTLSDTETQTMTKSTETVDDLHGRTFKICLPKRKGTKANCEKQKTSIKQEEQQKSQKRTSNNSGWTSEPEPDVEMKNEGKVSTREIMRVASERGITLKRAMAETNSNIDINEVYKLLRQQFPHLKELMESRFPDDSFQTALNLKKENFGKIEQSFSEVHRVIKLTDLGKSVCLLVIKEKMSSAGVQGTGFVLFDNVVLTNSHLFEQWTKHKIDKWWEYIEITAEFENRDGKSGRKFKATVYNGSCEVDYALLQLGKNTGQETAEVPPGLLKRAGPLPENGEACIFGHPSGGLKKMDPTCIIKKEEREQAVDENLPEYKEYIFTVYSIKQGIRNDPVSNICVTYNSFMYHGSSGSPVFDADSRVFGLHSGGFFYDFPKPKQSVIEFAFPLLYILQKLVLDLEKNNDAGLLERIWEEAEGNPYLEKILRSVSGQGGQEVQGREDQEKVEETEYQRETLETGSDTFEEPMEIESPN